MNMVRSVSLISDARTSACGWTALPGIMAATRIVTNSFPLRMSDGRATGSENSINVGSLAIFLVWARFLSPAQVLTKQTSIKGDFSLSRQAVAFRTRTRRNVGTPIAENDF